jgi:hypothetical protein
LDNKSDKVPAQSSAGKKISRLSTGECDALGGLVVNLMECEDSRSACRTVDQHGNEHLVCISGKKK